MFFRVLDMKGDMVSSYGIGWEGWLVVVCDIFYVFGVGCILCVWWVKILKWIRRKLR